MADRDGSSPAERSTEGGNTQHTHTSAHRNEVKLADAHFSALCNDEMLADCDKVLHAISVLEEKFSSIQTGTYAHLTSEAYKAFPTFQLIILGQQVTFMVDSGATSSVVKAGFLNSS